MKIYYFSKPIIRKPQYYNCSLGYGTGQEKEYASKEELIEEFEKMLDSYDTDNSTLTTEEIESIVCEEMPDYDYYTIQLETFDGYSTTIITFKTREECTTWIINHADGDKSFTIVGQRWGTDYREVEG